MTKSCSRALCEQQNPQPIENFCNRRSRKGGKGISSCCKSCSKKDLNAWRKANPEKLAAKQRRDALARNYWPHLTGLQAEKEWQKLYEAQKGLCGLCELVEATDTDHCHRSGKVRGLLCNPCNLILGKLERRPWFVEGMRRYLGAD